MALEIKLQSRTTQKRLFSDPYAIVSVPNLNVGCSGFSFLVEAITFCFS